jgi:ketosteroid isomerase-like protein
VRHPQAVNAGAKPAPVNSYNRRTPEKAFSMTEADITTLEEQRYSAMLRKDIAALENLLDDELVYTDSSGRVDTKANYLDSFRGGSRNYRSIDRRNVKVMIRGNTALVFCDLHIQATLQDAIRNVRTRALAVWSGTNGIWRLLALHSTAYRD